MSQEITDLDARRDPVDRSNFSNSAEEPAIPPIAPSGASDRSEEPQPEPPTPAPKKKRNSGRTGATSAAGRARSALNATKHGSCAWTLILPTESDEGWRILLALFSQRYPVDENTIEYRYVLKTAQAEWHRIRCENNFNSFLATTAGLAPYNWKPEQVHQHDLLLRYKTAAERTFQRANSQLEQHFKTHKPTIAPHSESRPKPSDERPSQEMPAPEPPPEPRTKMLITDPNSPTGYSYSWEFPPRPGVSYPCPAPPPPTTSDDLKTG